MVPFSVKGEAGALSEARLIVGVDGVSGPAEPEPPNAAVGLAKPKSISFGTVSEGLAFQVLQHQEGDAVLRTNIVKSADVGMIQRRNRAGFALEALPGLGILREMRRENLDRNRAVQPPIERAIDLAHAARTQRTLDFIRPELGARGKPHQCAPL